MQRDGNFSTPCGQSVAGLGTLKKLAFSILSTWLQYCIILNMAPKQRNAKCSRVCCTIWEEESYAQWQSILKIRGLQSLPTQSFKCLKEVETLWKSDLHLEESLLGSWKIFIGRYLIGINVFYLGLVGGKYWIWSKPRFQTYKCGIWSPPQLVWSVPQTGYCSKWGQRWSTSP